MAIKASEFKYEEEKLLEIEQKIDEEISIKEQDDNALKEKMAVLKKKSKGKYNQELETIQKLYDITNKNLNNYIEAKENPYFARIDFREYRRDKESYYIGKFGVGDTKTGDEVVIDWRSPIADLYYSGIQGEVSYEAPVGWIDGELSLKRKFIIRDEKLKDAFDEGINEIIVKSGVGEEEGNALIDEFLKINLEESISNKLKDVVATIQKEQNDIIRATLNGPIIVQGSAGSGKTTVALHRLAYLLYKYKKNLKGSDILVIAPNKIFLDYISEVLPSLGVDMVKQRTYNELCKETLKVKGKIITKDKKLAYVLENPSNEDINLILNSSKVKGSLFYKLIMDRYVRFLEKHDVEDIEDIKVYDYVLFSNSEIKRLYVKDLIKMPLDKRKDEIKRYFKVKLKQKISEVSDKVDFYYDYTIARLKKTMEDGVERRKKLIDIYDERDEKKEYIKKNASKILDEYFENWKHSDIKKLYLDLFENEEIFKEVTDNKLPKEISDYIASNLRENIENNLIDSDDLCPMLYLKFKIEGINESEKYKHIVIDEAQDYSLFQFVTLKEIATYDSFTIVGDIGQGIYYYKGTDDWDKLTEGVFKNKAKYLTLTQSYRSTVEIIEFANKVLKKQKNSLKPAMPVLRHGKAPEVVEFKDNKEFAERIDEIVKETKDMGKNSVAVIGRTYEECKRIRNYLKKYSGNTWTLVKDTDKTIKLETIIIPSYMTKGLEFDCSVIYNCNSENYKENELDKKILYVALTRALHLEYVFYNGEKSPLI